MATLPMILPGQIAQAWIKRDHASLSPSYARAYPFVMDRGLGSEVWDADGNRFIDMNAGIAVTSTGHSHPMVVQAIKDQAERFLHMSGTDFYFDKMVLLGEKLNAIRPMKEDIYTFFTNSGAEAVEVAIKLARHHTGRQHFIGFLGGFHGRTMGALSFTSSKAIYRKNFGPTMPGVIHIPYPNAYRPILHSLPGEDYGDAVLDYLEDVIFGQMVAANEVAGILIEPIQGEGGYVVPTPNFFPRLREICNKHGIMLIADEVQSGMGRTGKWWAIENFGVEPDIITSAKGIASGLPLGAVMARKSVMNWRPGQQGSTFGGNPLSCAASLATIDAIEQEAMLENTLNVGDYAMDVLSEMAVRHPTIGEVRGKGLMIGVEFVLDKHKKTIAHDHAENIVAKAFEKGALFLSCGKSSIRMSPALNISRHLMDEALSIFEDAVTEAEAEL
ncbi:MAG: acetyl ornithine aminotransferase family protein [Anaerolineae bacterium]